MHKAAMITDPYYSSFEKNIEIHPYRYKNFRT